MILVISPLFEQRGEPVIHLPQFLQLLLFQFFVDQCHVLLHLLLIQLLQSPQHLQILLLGHLPCEDVCHYIFFILLQRVKRLTQLQNGHCAILITNGSILSSCDLVPSAYITDLNGG